MKSLYNCPTRYQTLALQSYFSNQKGTLSDLFPAMSARFCHPESLPWAVFTTENMRRLTLNTRMHPENDSDLREEEIASIPQPLFAGRKLNRQLSSSAQTTLLESLDTIDEVEKFSDWFQEDMKDLRPQAEVTQNRELDTIPEERPRIPSSGSLDPQELIDNESFFLEGETASSETTDVSSNAPEMLRADVYVTKPRYEFRDRLFSAPVYTNTAPVSKPPACKPRPLLISKKPVGYRWNGTGLSSVALPRRDGIDMGRSSASTFIDFSIHQGLAQYKISSDKGPLKTPPISPEDPSPKEPVFPKRR